MKDCIITNTSVTQTHGLKYWVHLDPLILIRHDEVPSTLDLSSSEGAMEWISTK